MHIALWYLARRARTPDSDLAYAVPPSPTAIAKYFRNFDSSRVPHPKTDILKYYNTTITQEKAIIKNK